MKHNISTTECLGNCDYDSNEERVKGRLADMLRETGRYHADFISSIIKLYFIIKYKSHSFVLQK